MTARGSFAGSGARNRLGHAVLIVVLGLLSVLASADGGGGGHGGGGHGGGGHGGGGHSGGHSGHSGHTGGGHAGGGHAGRSHAVGGGLHHRSSAGIEDRFHGDALNLRHPHSFPHTTVGLGRDRHGLFPGHTLVGLDHHDLHDGHRFHHHPVGFHGHVFSGFGYSSFYVPSYYRYRYSCDPYSVYYDPRYCDRYFPSSGSYVYGSTLPLTATALPAVSLEEGATRTASEDDLDTGHIPDGVGARIPLISIPEPPDVVR